MFEQIRYVNHLNEPLYFGEDHLYVNLNTLHDYEWDVVSQHDRIRNVERTIHTKDFPVRIAGVTEDEGIAKRNALFEIPEKDVVDMTPGRMIINGYYLPCYITESSKSYYSIDGKFLSCDMTLTTDYPFWIREIPLEITTDDLGQNIVNPSAFAANFRITIYGAVSNPSITIGNHVYKVNVTLAQGDMLIIDSLAKSIQTTSDGDLFTNVFDKRYRDSYIFQKIKSGRNGVSKSSNFDVDIMIYDERSEPKWTDEQIQNWIYTRSGANVIETTYTYVRPSGITLYIDSLESSPTFGHLIQEKSVITKVQNYFKLENGRLIAYHD